MDITERQAEPFCGCGDQIVPDTGARCGTCASLRDDEIERLRAELADLRDGLTIAYMQGAAAKAEEMREQIDGLWKDAERYRWLRERGGGSWHLTPESGGASFKATDRHFDASVDAAMQEGK